MTDIGSDNVEHQIEFLDKVLNPEVISSIYDNIEKVSVLIYNDTKPTKMDLLNITPFMTLFDIKLAVYEVMGKKSFALPDYTFIGVKSPSNDEEIHSFEYGFASIESPDAPIILKEPITHIKSNEPDTRFIESSGDKKILRIYNRERITLESSYFNSNTNNVLHVHFYKNLKKALGDQNKNGTIGNKEWNGFLYAYFPKLNINSSFDSNNQYIDEQNMRVDAFSKKKDFYEKINKLLKEESVNKISLNGIKYLRLYYNKPKTFLGIETVFYNTAVNNVIPYMRLFTVESTPISKIHMLNNKPNLEEQQLLIQWSKERNVTPERISALVKIRISKSLYSTLRLFDDGTADITNQPPKSVRILEQNDIENLAKVTGEALKGFPFLKQAPNAINGTFIFKINNDSQMSKSSFRMRLNLFSSIFQEIKPLMNENPFIMLRYKLISNFNTEDNIQTFITQILTRKKLHGDEKYNDIPDLISEEFDINMNDATMHLNNYMTNKGNVKSTLLPEGELHVEENRTGIDIAIFARHPSYFFHLYNIDSYTTLRRVISFLSVLFNYSTDALSVPKSSVSIIKAADSAEAEDEDDFESVVGAENDFQSVTTPPKDGDTNNFNDLMFDTDMPTLYDEEDVLPNAIDDNQEAEEQEDTTDKFKLELMMDTKAAAETAINNESKMDEDGKYTDLKSYFLNKLKEADRNLFEYNKTNPSTEAYGTKCQVSNGRQPAVLNEEQYQNMLKEYDDVIKSKEIAFYVYPMNKNEKFDDTIKEYYTLMRYGSPKKRNYYLCSPLFCIRDNILVREKEYQGTLLRRKLRGEDGATRTTKSPKSCPFCEGTLIENTAFPKVNETIIKRVVKGGTADKLHNHIGFLTEANPNGLYLPCCFIKNKPLYYGDNAFPSDMVKDTVEDLTKTHNVTYENVLLAIPSSYILGVEKLPLDGFLVRNKKPSDPQIGVLPPVLDKYFSQDFNDFINRMANPQRIKPKTRGFMRIGVDNSKANTNDAFLSVVAPFFGKKSAKDMKTFIKDIVNPRLFITLNYGNLLLEMYKPNKDRPVINDEFKDWAKKSLHIKKITESNKEYAIRAFMSYNYFIEWLESTNTRKEYRHFANLFMQPGIMNTNVGQIAETEKPVEDGLRPGIVFIVLDVLKSGELKVRCPLYPMNSKMYESLDYGFIFHHYTGVWEPVFYFDNTSPSERQILAYSLIFSNNDISKFPEIITKRLDEFKGQCSTVTGSKGYYASYSGTSSKKCVGISALIEELKVHESISIYGIVRDSYNHVAGIVYMMDDDEKKLVPVPVIDDGLTPVILDGKTILDWDDFTPASIENILSFYKKFIYDKYQKQYEIINKVKSKATHRIESVRLNNGIFIPVEKDESSGINIPVVEVDEMEWDINRTIIMGDDVNPESLYETFNINSNEMNETYQHLRITFSNWIDTNLKVKDIIIHTINRNDIPLFEKRKRLEVILFPIIEEWMSESDEDKDKTASLLRVDCLLQNESNCSGNCSWKKESSRCLIHVPQDSSNKVSTVRILLLRIIEELLRFGKKRMEILNKKISKISIIDSAIRTGDQYIIPETSLEWTELLRNDWSETNAHKPVYLEEMSTEVKEKPRDENETDMPENLEEIFGDNKKFKLYPSPTGNILPFLEKLNVDVSKMNDITDKTKMLTRDQIKKIVLETGLPIIQILLVSDLFEKDIYMRPFLDIKNKKLAVLVVRDKSVSILVKDTENPDFIEFSDLSKSVADKIKPKFKAVIK